MKIKQWLNDHKLVFKKDLMEAEMARNYAVNESKRLSQTLETGIADAHKEAKKLCAKFYEIEFRPLGKSEYTVCCNFNTNMMAHANHDPHFLEYIAAQVAWDIEQHIKSAKFLHIHPERIYYNDPL